MNDGTLGGPPSQCEGTMRPRSGVTFLIGSSGSPVHGLLDGLGTTSDKEALAVVKSLQHRRHWLEGTKLPIEVLTDHKNLEYFTKPRILN